MKRQIIITLILGATAQAPLPNLDSLTEEEHPLTRNGMTLHAVDFATKLDDAHAYSREWLQRPENRAKEKLQQHRFQQKRTGLTLEGAPLPPPPTRNTPPLSAHAYDISTKEGRAAWKLDHGITTSIWKDRAFLTEYQRRERERRRTVVDFDTPPRRIRKLDPLCQTSQRPPTQKGITVRAVDFDCKQDYVRAYNRERIRLPEIKSKYLITAKTKRWQQKGLIPEGAPLPPSPPPPTRNVPPLPTHAYDVFTKEGRVAWKIDYGVTTSVWKDRAFLAERQRQAVKRRKLVDERSSSSGFSLAPASASTSPHAHADTRELEDDETQPEARKKSALPPNITNATAGGASAATGTSNALMSSHERALDKIKQHLFNDDEPPPPDANWQHDPEWESLLQSTT